jgi:hypothetical protein
MPEIITPGQLPSEKTYTVTCSNCRTMFKFKQGEARYNNGDQRDGDYLTINCPLPGCGKTVTKSVSQKSYSYWDDR